MKKKRFILFSLLLMMVVLVVGYKYDVSNFENDINLELSSLKSKKEIKDYTIHSEENKGLKKVYVIEVEHTTERKEKYPKKIVITYNPFGLKKNRLDFNLKK